MNHPRLLSQPAALFLAMAALIAPMHGAPGLDKVSVAVQVRTPGDAYDASKGRADTQVRALEILVTNRTREELTDLSVKWTLFGFDLKDDEPVVAESGEVKSTLAPMRAEKIETKSATFKSSAAGTQKAGGKGKGKSKGKGSMKRVPASGTRYAGWGVQVFQNGTVVGEAFSRIDLKDDL